MPLCVFADAMKASYMGLAGTGRAAVLVAVVCVRARAHASVPVCVCVWVRGNYPQRHDCIYYVEMKFTITSPSSVFPSLKQRKTGFPMSL